MTASSLKRKRGLEMNKKVSSSKMATNASAILRASGNSRIQKSLAASVLSQSISGKTTGKNMEIKASHVLKSSKYSDVTKSLAASVLSQSDKYR